MSGEVYGWAGKILRVDLTSGKISEEETLPKYGPFIGGSGIGFKVMWDEVPPETGPFDPENRIVFAVGPLVGSEAPGATRTVVASKSPQSYEEKLPDRTETTRSAFGGSFGPELKYAGYDAIVVWGRSEEPVYLYVHDDEAELLDADRLWGKGALETDRLIKRELGDTDVKVASIGPAGENLVRFACIIHRGHGDHGAGQGGFGAVMGSKRLKAIAVKSGRGMSVYRVAKPKEFREACLKALQLITPSGMTPKSDSYVKGVDPYLTSLFWHWRRTDIGKVVDPELCRLYRVGRTGCCSCLCYDEFDVPGVGRGSMMCIQYFYAWAGKKGVENFVAKHLGDDYGVNVYEMYLMIPWLIGLWKRGVITEEASGIPFSKYPGREFLQELYRKVAHREGMGDLLAEGVVRASLKLGVLKQLLEEELAENLPIPPEEAVAWSSYGGHGYCGHYDPRDYVVSGLMLAVHNRDPFDNRHEYIDLTWWSNLSLEEQMRVAKSIYGTEKAVHPIGKPRYSEEEAYVAHMSDIRACLKDSLTLCDWIFPVIVTVYEDREPPYVGDTSLEARMFSTATGIQVSEREFYTYGERINNLIRAVMVREMATRDMRNLHDTLPEHYFKNPSPHTGSPPLDREKFEELKTKYYRIKGWDHNGLPTRLKLEELGLKDVADELQRLGLLGEG